jgi:hypothetical protein
LRVGKERTFRLSGKGERKTRLYADSSVATEKVAPVHDVVHAQAPALSRAGRGLDLLVPGVTVTVQVLRNTCAIIASGQPENRARSL